VELFTNADKSDLGGKDLTDFYLNGTINGLILATLNAGAWRVRVVVDGVMTVDVNRAVFFHEFTPMKAP
jgi:hypothetical protein